MTLPAQDIVERLREPEFVTIDTGRLAADRIEAQGATISRLTADNEALGKELAESRAAHHRTSHKAVKRLRALWREKQAAEKRLAEVETERDKAERKLVESRDKAVTYLRHRDRLVSALRKARVYVEMIVTDEFADTGTDKQDLAEIDVALSGSDVKETAREGGE